MKTLIEFFGPWYIRLCGCIAAGILWVAGYNLISWGAVEGTTWAAWIQAVGSIAAIIVAVVVMNTQHSRDRRQEQLRALEREINFALSVESFAGRLASAQRNLAAAAKSNQMNKTAMTYQISAFAALSRIGDAIPSWEAGEVVATYLLSLQQNCHTTAAIVDTAAIDPPDDLAFFAESLDAWAKKSEDIALQVNRHRVIKFVERSRQLR
jgi:hypothetical protein